MKLIHQVVVQRLRTILRIRHQIMLTIAGLILTVPRRLRAAGVVVLRPVLRHLRQPLEVRRIVVVVAGIELALFDVSGRCVVHRRLDVVRDEIPGLVCLFRDLLQDDVFGQLLLDPLLQVQERQLEDLHRLNHARRQLHLLAHPHLL
jgi:hypothetical protein